MHLYLLKLGNEVKSVVSCIFLNRSCQLAPKCSLQQYIAPFGPKQIYPLNGILIGSAVLQSYRYCCQRGYGIPRHRHAREEIAHIGRKNVGVSRLKFERVPFGVRVGVVECELTAAYNLLDGWIIPVLSARLIVNKTK